MLKPRVTRHAVATLRRVPAFGAVALAAALLAACGASGDKPATQTAARVNKEEITVHQINNVLAAQRGLRPEQAESAGRQVLERLIDQELALQKAAEQKIDRDPRVVQQIEAARRDIVARAYTEKLAEGAPKPSAAEIQKYYDEHPALFAQRRIYQLQEIVVAADPSQVESLQAQARKARNANEFVEVLKAQNVKYAATQALRAAEQIPLQALPALAELKDGQAMMTPTPTGVTLLFLAASKAEPVDLERATPAISNYLLNERKRKVVADDLKALRAAATVQYVGKYAENAPAAEPLPRAPTPAEVAASAAATLDTQSINQGLGLKRNAGSAAASAVEAADAAVRPASAPLDAAAINKGLGLKP
jgi:EpsD family peptidyl-prolyl cis-trans isomerase